MPLKPKKYHNALEYLFDEDVSPGVKVSIYMDKYQGPVSRRAQAVLRTIALEESDFKTLFCVLLHPKMMNTEKNSSPVDKENFAFFTKFYFEQKEKDSLRVAKF